MAKKIKKQVKKYYKKAIALGLILALTATYVTIEPAKAAALTSVKATLLDSRPAVTSQINFSFTTVSAVAAAGTIKFAFADAWTINTSIAAADISATGMTVVATCGAGGDEVTVTNSNTGGNKHVTLTVCAGDTVAAGAKTVNIGTGANKNTNPTKVAAAGTADIYSITIGAPQGTDSGDALVAIIEGVTVSVTIDESLSFVLAEETAANCPATMPGTDRSDDANHTDTAITFGTLSSGNAFNHSCHLATVSTNAGTGYTTTAQKTQLLTAGSNTIADGTCDGACSASVSAVWSTVSSNGFGYCLQDVTGNPALTTDASDDAGTGAVDWEAVDQCNDATPLFKTYPTTATTEPVMKSYTPVSGDQIRMGTTLNYPTTQVAGTYTTTLIFITTPTF